MPTVVYDWSENLNCVGRERQLDLRISEEYWIFLEIQPGRRKVSQTRTFFTVGGEAIKSCKSELTPRTAFSKMPNQVDEGAIEAFPPLCGALSDEYRWSSLCQGMDDISAVLSFREGNLLRYRRNNGTEPGMVVLLSEDEGGRIKIVTGVIQGR